MFRSFLKAITLLAVASITASCAGPSQVREPQNVPPGKLYAGPIINITAPNSEGWQLLKSDSSGLAFGRRGNAPDESFTAQVATFNPPQTDSPEEFESLMVKGAQSDANTERFQTKSFTHKFTSARGYPCVQMNNISEDTKAQSGPNKTEPLIMQNEHLYCRHPVRKNIGFVVIYSHRGKELHPDFQTEAHSFIEGIQVPSTPSSK
ncbi:MAG: hypothetical protein IT389_12785 [Nitrospira sp.]|nr:hypothetical protein [Nitrospira sp.]